MSKINKDEYVNYDAFFEGLGRDVAEVNQGGVFEGFAIVNTKGLNAKALKDLIKDSRDTAPYWLKELGDKLSGGEDVDVPNEVDNDFFYSCGDKNIKE